MDLKFPAVAGPHSHMNKCVPVALVQQGLSSTLSRASIHVPAKAFFPQKKPDVRKKALAAPVRKKNSSSCVLLLCWHGRGLFSCTSLAKEDPQQGVNDVLAGAWRPWMEHERNPSCTKESGMKEGPYCYSRDMRCNGGAMDKVGC